MKTKENTISPREEEEWSATVFQSDNLSSQTDSKNQVENWAKVIYQMFSYGSVLTQPFIWQLASQFSHIEIQD